MNDDQKNQIIQDQAHLDAFVYRWSTDRGLDPVKFQKVATKLIPDVHDRPVSESVVAVSLNHFYGRIDEEARGTTQALNMLVTPASAWGLEVVKHLAIINTTGIAGSAALLTRFDEEADFRYALILFTVGILISLLTLWLGSQVFSSLLKQLPKRMEILKSASNWDDYGAALGAVSFKKSKAFGMATTISGWCAAVVAISGIVIIIRVLWRMSA